MFSHTEKKKKKVHRVGSTLRMVKAGLAASQRCDGELTFRFGRRMKTRDKCSFFLVLDYKGERLELFLTDETKSYLTSYLSNLPDLKPSGDSERVCRVTARRTVHGSRRAARLSASSYLFHRSFYSVCLVPSET